MKTIYISEDRIPDFKMLLDESEEKLLEDPIGAKPSKKLEIRGYTSGKLRKLLRDADIITVKEKIDEPHNEETGALESRYYLSYKVPKKNFKKKIKRLYQKLFEND